MARDTQTLSVSLSADPLYNCQPSVLSLPTNQSYLLKADQKLSSFNENLELFDANSEFSSKNGNVMFITFYLIRRIRRFVLEKPRRPCFNETGIIFKIASNQKGKNPSSPRNRMLSYWPEILANIIFSYKTRHSRQKS